MDEAWMKFELSGKVTDYLKFKRTELQEIPDAKDGILGKERPDGTEYYSDRNGLTGNAGWRL